MIQPHHRSTTSPRNAMTLETRNKSDQLTLDPLLTMQVAMDHHTGAETPMGAASSRSSIASICFAPKHGGQVWSGDSTSLQEEEDSASSSSDEEDLHFQCRSLVQSEARFASDPTRGARQSAAAASLFPGRYLASCHANGECFLWDLNRNSVAQENLVAPRGPGWMLRRLGDGEEGSQFLYQTRDPIGIVSIHSWDHPSKPIMAFPTMSQTFCSATPCRGNSNLLALPSSNDSETTIRDLRMDPSSAPVALFSGSGPQDDINAENESAFGGRKHGMLTSLAFAETALNNSPSGRPIVACGMESGTVFLHDLRMIGKEIPPSLKLAQDPVLALDLAPSTGASKPSVVAVAGMAGENTAQQELPVSEQGTVAILKAIIQDDEFLRLRLRSRLSTCKPMGEGKPGVNLCRFQPGDGRLFAVAGWDQRVRIMDRSSSSKVPLKAILRGHDASVSALDWAPDSTESGLCATAAADGRIQIWRCFSKA